MKALDTKRIATIGLLIILSFSIIFHLLVLSGAIPYEMVWGGRLKNESEMISFELVSILINVIMLGIVSVFAGVVKVKMNTLIIRIALWLMFGVFLLNTLGNLLSINDFERWFFTPLTLVLALFSLRLAINKKSAIAK